MRIPKTKDDLAKMVKDVDRKMKEGRLVDLTNRPNLLEKMAKAQTVVEGAIKGGSMAYKDIKTNVIKGFKKAHEAAALEIKDLGDSKKDNERLEFLKNESKKRPLTRKELKEWGEIKQSIEKRIWLQGRRYTGGQ